MGVQIILGAPIAARTKGEVAASVLDLKEKHNRVPGLAVIVVGTRGDAMTYAKLKRKACEEVGIVCFEKYLPATSSEAEVIRTVRSYNRNSKVHGVVLQLPLPSNLNSAKILSEISTEKDVDGVHPANIGRLSLKGQEPVFAPSVALACMEVLQQSEIAVRGKHAVVVGRSNSIGLPVAMMLLKADATVTLCHTATQDLEGIVRQADILVSTVCQPEMIRGSWIKPGAVIIDVGSSPVPDKASSSSGYRLVGDVAFDECKEVASVITSVPGGVDPVASAMLMKNTLKSAVRIITGVAREEREATPGPAQANRSGHGLPASILGGTAVALFLFKILHGCGGGGGGGS